MFIDFGGPNMSRMVPRRNPAPPPSRLGLFQASHNLFTNINGACRATVYKLVGEGGGAYKGLKMPTSRRGCFGPSCHRFARVKKWSSALRLVKTEERLSLAIMGIGCDRSHRGAVFSLCSCVAIFFICNVFTQLIFAVVAMV